jgi:DNA-binding MarR family transcriptional regulator
MSLTPPLQPAVFADLDDAPAEEVAPLLERAALEFEPGVLKRATALLLDRVLRLLREGSRQEVLEEAGALSRGISGEAASVLESKNPTTYGAWASLYELLAEAARRSDRAAIPSLLKNTQGHGLAILELLKAEGRPVPRAEIRRRLSLGEAHLSHLLRDLEEADLILRYKPEGGREVLVELGRVGREVVSQSVLPPWLEQFEEALREIAEGAPLHAEALATRLTEAGAPSRLAADRLVQAVARLRSAESSVLPIPTEATAAIERPSSASPARKIFTPLKHQTLAWNGINATTGEPLLPQATLEEIAALACGEVLPSAEIEELQRWRSRMKQDHLDTRFEFDVCNLAETGWGVIFPEGRQDELRAAFAPLLALRKTQASVLKEGRYRELVYRHGEFKNRFLARHRVGPGPADPDILPYYLLIVGNPEEISFRFQYQLDVQYAVGRISFDTLEEYARYAESVVAAEQGRTAAARRVSFFGVSNPGDRATASSLKNLVEPLAARIAHDRQDWSVETVLGEDATKAALAARLGGARTPSLLFTASHGVVFDPMDSRQLFHQGALLCQDWPGPQGWQGPIVHDHYLAGEDVPDAASPAGLIAFFFACYGAGTPLYDSLEINGEQRRLATESFVAHLPQRLLGHPKGGALAVVSHIDHPPSFSLGWPESGSQLQVYASALNRLLEGSPVGWATECFNQHYAEVVTLLSEEREEIRWGAKPDLLSLSELWTSAINARSHTLLGDPAVRL